MSLNWEREDSWSAQGRFFLPFLSVWPVRFSANWPCRFLGVGHQIRQLQLRSMLSRRGSGYLVSEIIGPKIVPARALPSKGSSCRGAKTGFSLWESPFLSVIGPAAKEAPPKRKGGNFRLPRDFLSSEAKNVFKVLNYFYFYRRFNLSNITAIV